MRPNRWWIVVAGGVGALALAVGAIFLEFTPPALTVLATDAIVLGFGGLAIVLGLLALFGTPAERDHDVPFPPPDSDDETADFEHVTETIDVALERHQLGDEWFERGKRSRQRHEARVAIRRTAIDVLAECHDVSGDDATSRISDGTWTEDPRAAAFLSTDVRPPLRLRLVDWAYGVQYHRRLEAAVEEIARLHADRRGADRRGVGRTDTERSTAEADLDGVDADHRAADRLGSDQLAVEAGGEQS